MAYDFTNKSDREELHGIVKRTIEGHRNNIKLELTVNSLKCIERLIETQERIIEDQEERIAIMTEGGWHKTAEEKPKLETDFPFESITVVCADAKRKMTYPMNWCRRKVRGKIVYRWEYMYDNICYNEPYYWQYLPEPPKEGEA